jgi:hypothetical protein
MFRPVIIESGDNWGSRDFDVPTIPIGTHRRPYTDRSGDQPWTVYRQPFAEEPGGPDVRAVMEEHNLADDGVDLSALAEHSNLMQFGRVRINGRWETRLVDYGAVDR